MKKLLVLILLLISITAFALESEYMPVILNATANATSTALNFSQAYHFFLCDVIATGAPTDLTVRVDGNITNDGVFDVTGLASKSCGSMALSTKCSFAIVNQPASQIRIVASGLTGGTSPTYSIWCKGTE